MACAQKKSIVDSTFPLIVAFRNLFEYVSDPGLGGWPQKIKAPKPHT